MTTRTLFNSLKNCQSTFIAGVLFSIFATAASPVEAITLVSDRAALGVNDQIDWSSLGKVFNPFSPNVAAFLPNSFSAKSKGGLGLDVNIVPATSPGVTPPFILQTSFPPSGIPTNFSLGDFLLFTGLTPGSFPAIGNPGPVTITFEQPVLGAGTQIAVDDTLKFTVFVSAFDNADNLLGTFSTAGISSLALDNSAVFLGVSSDIPNIKRLVFSSSESNRALAINSLSIATVSEPNFILGLSAFGILSAAFRLRRKVSKKV